MVQNVKVITEPENNAPDAMNLGTILIVEDDLVMQKTLRRTFTQERYAVVVAGDGQTALDLFRSEQPLAVVLDLIQIGRAHV